MCVSLSLFLSYWQEGVIIYLISFPLLIFVCMLVKYNLRYYKILVYIVCYKHFTARKIKESNYHVYLTWSTPWIYSVTSHFGILKAFRIPSTFWAFRKNLGSTKPSILPLSTTGPASTEQRLDSLLCHLGLLLSPALCFLCTFGASFLTGLLGWSFKQYMEIVANEYLGYAEEQHCVDKLVNMTCKHGCQGHS